MSSSPTPESAPWNNGWEPGQESIPQHPVAPSQHVLFESSHVDELDQATTTSPTRVPKNSISRLPPECLHLIISYHAQDLFVLHSLLLVNKAFFQLTVPILFRSPFRLIFDSSLSRQLWRQRLQHRHLAERYRHEQSQTRMFGETPASTGINHEPIRPVEPGGDSVRNVKLVWLLLGSLSHLRWVMDDLPPLSYKFPMLRIPQRELEASSARTTGCHEDVRKSGQEVGDRVRYLSMSEQAKYLVDSTPSTPMASFSSAAFPFRTEPGIEPTYNHTADEGSSRRLTMEVDSGPSNIHEMTVDYLQYYRDQWHKNLSDALFTLFPSISCWTMDEWMQSQERSRYAATIEQGFLLHRSEAITSLTIPLTRASNFLDVATRLKSLRRVNFVDIGNRMSIGVKEAVQFITLHDSVITKAAKEGPLSESTESTATTTGKTSSIITDGRFHPGDTPDLRWDSSLNSSSVMLTEIKIGEHMSAGSPDLYKILQAMRCPRIVDLSGWTGASADIMQIPREYLETLLLPWNVPLRAQCPIHEFLAKCPRLQRLHIEIGEPHGRELFLTRTNKTTKRDERDEGGGNKDLPLVHPLHHRLNETGVHSIHSQCLKVLEIAGPTESVALAAMNASETFCNTLERLVVLSRSSSSVFQSTGAIYTRFPEGLPKGIFYPPSGSRSQRRRVPLEPSIEGERINRKEAAESSEDLDERPVLSKLEDLELQGDVAIASFFVLDLLQRCRQLRTLVLRAVSSEVQPCPTAFKTVMKLVPRTLQELELSGLHWWIVDEDFEWVLRTKALPDLRRLKLLQCTTKSRVSHTLQNPGMESWAMTSNRQPTWPIPEAPPSAPADSVVEAAANAEIPEVWPPPLATGLPGQGWIHGSLYQPPQPPPPELRSEMGLTPRGVLRMVKQRPLLEKLLLELAAWPYTIWCSPESRAPQGGSSKREGEEGEEEEGLTWQTLPGVLETLCNDRSTSLECDILQNAPALWM